MDRRHFLKVVGATGAYIAIDPSTIKNELFANTGAMFRAYERVQLIDGTGERVKASQLRKETNYVFNYPHVSTPSILLDLEKSTAKDVRLESESGEEYVWESGAGKERTIVAYSAICSHQLSHPTPDDSFLQYVPKDRPTMAFERSGVIVCSSHLSVFDATAGAKRLAGPAVDALASIVIEVGPDDSLWAVGVLGTDRFHDYFKTFKPELKKFYGGKRKGRRLVKSSAKIVPLTKYTKEIIQY